MNTTKSDKHKVLSKIQFLENRLVSLDFHLPETQQYLLSELDLQRCILAELEVEDAFASIDQEDNRTGDPYLMVRFLVSGVPLSSVATQPHQNHEPDLDTGWTSTGDSGADGDVPSVTPQIHGDDPGPSQGRSRDRPGKPLSTKTSRGKTAGTAMRGWCKQRRHRILCETTATAESESGDRRCAWFSWCHCPRYGHKRLIRS